MKKVLVITYYWPPAGGPGVQRWLKFVKYLREFGIEPVVYIPENPDYPMIDSSFENDIPNDITILKHRIFEPYALARLFSKKDAKTISKGIINTKKQSFIQKAMLWIRGNFFIPDARKFWVKPSIKFLEKYLQNHDIKTIITTGPPHSVHLIGMGLKKRNNVKWLADFRDPWTTIGYHDKLKLTRRSTKKHKRLEEQVLGGADQLVVTSFTTKKEFTAITDTPIEVITNGFDQELTAVGELDADFTLSHIGSLLTGRNPHVLWKVLEDLIFEEEGFAERFKLCLAGTVSEDVLADVRHFIPEENIKLLGYISHAEAIRMQQCSQMLLLIEIDTTNTRCIIPGKLFEYMNAKRPIVALGPEGWDVKKIIQSTQTGDCFNYDEQSVLKETIKKHFKAYMNRELSISATDLTPYTRKSLTGQLSKLL